MSEERYVERNWTESETRALLRIRGNEELSRQISGTVRDSLIYGEITRLLRAQGINRSHRQVTNKLKTLRNKFRKIHEHHKNSGLGKVYWSFYDLCKSIWGTRRPANTSVSKSQNVKLEEPQSTSIEGNRSTDVEVSISDDEEPDITPKVTEPPRKKSKKDHIAPSVGDEEAFHIQDERDYEEQLRREAREEQKEERTSLMAMWKEMMEFHGNLLKEFIHHPSRPTSGPYDKHAHYNQGSSSFPSTSNTAPYDSPGMETENESAMSQEEEEEKYLPSEIPVIVDVASLKCTNDDQSNITLPLSPQPTQSTEKTDLQMSVLRRQETVLQLQEEYYALKIRYLKDKLAGDQGQNDKS